MKQVTRCYNCKGIIRVSGSFNAELSETKTISVPEGDFTHTTKIRISLCRDCAEKAGYKVKRVE